MFMNLKNKIVILIACIPLVFTSCDDVKEDLSGNGTFGDGAGLGDLSPAGTLKNVYTSLQLSRVFDATGYPFLWGDIGVDILSGASFSNVTFPLYTNNFVVTDRENLRMWREHYFALARVNRAIESFRDFKKQGDLDDNQTNNYIAQARFVRAVLNFNLVKLYENPILRLDSGGSLVTDINDVDLSGQTNSNPTEMYDAIINDLLFAEANLSDEGNFSVATSLASKALLGKVYLQAAGMLANNVYNNFSVVESEASLSAQDLYAKASSLFSEVIGSGKYSLLKNYGDIFDPIESNSNTELIFAVDFVSNGVGSGSSFGDAFGVSGNTPNGGFSTVLPQYEFIMSYFDHSLSDVNGRDINTREEAGLRPFNFDSFFGNIYPLPVSDQRFLVNISTFDVRDVNLTNSIEGVRKNRDIGVFRTYKYRKKIPVVTSISDDQEFDFPYLRYADVLLMKAEAIVGEGGSLTEAIGYLNQVRRRAYLVETEGGTTPFGHEPIATVDGDSDKENLARKLNNLFDIPVDELRQLNLEQSVHVPSYVGPFSEDPTAEVALEARIANNNFVRLFRFDEEDGVYENLTTNVIERRVSTPTIMPRKGLSVDYNTFVLSSNSDVLAAILRERRKELCYEGHRRDDLIRNGVLEEVITTRTNPGGEMSVFSAVNTGALSDEPDSRGPYRGAEIFPAAGATNFALPSTRFQSFNYRLPIPQIEIERNQGLLKQNSGYPGS